MSKRLKKFGEDGKCKKKTKDEERYLRELIGNIVLGLWKQKGELRIDEIY